MKIFKLPDLGEGLPDAVIREWHVKEGEQIAAEQSLVTVETAKALVEVPSPWSGLVQKLFAAPDETLGVGQPLVGFADSEGREQKTEDRGPAADAGTVVGRIQESGQSLAAETLRVSTEFRPYTPAIRALARRLGVELSAHKPRSARFTEQEVHALATGAETAATQPKAADTTSPARRAMALAMSRARDQVAPMTLCDQVDISAWWGKESATLRLIRALQAACAAEPNLNALYENDVLRPAQTVNIGLAVDSPRGLYVPVLKDVAARDDEELLAQIETYKTQASETGIAQADLQGASILLSNFGGLAGRHATPVVLPPSVAILGAGRVFEAVLPVKGKPAVRPVLPLSVSADHRAVTGGELARFLKALMQALS